MKLSIKAVPHTWGRLCE